MKNAEEIDDTKKSREKIYSALLTNTNEINKNVLYGEKPFI